VVLAHGASDDHLLPQACQGFTAIADMTGENARHLILARAAFRHRVKIKACPVLDRPAFLIDADRKAPTRVAALRALLASGDRPVRCTAPSVLAPTSYQRYRLTLLLRILDYLEQAPSGATSLRTLASEIVYARELAVRSIEWTSSSHRRQTQRLVKVAKDMAAAGYRRLLNGRGAEGEGAKSRPLVAKDE
jgi:hypothetical protein